MACEKPLTSALSHIQSAYSEFRTAIVAVYWLTRGLTAYYDVYTTKSVRGRK